MDKSIRRFLDKGISNISNQVSMFCKGEWNIDKLSEGLMEEMQKLVKDIITETLEMLDEVLYENAAPKYKRISKCGRRKYITPCGEIIFTRSYYLDQDTNKYTHLLDDFLGIIGTEHLSVGAAAQIVKEAIDTSYSKAGYRLTTEVSKQTVKNVIHSLEVPTLPPAPAERKRVKNIYVLADEDHVHKQFDKVKGDLNKSDVNSMIVKLAVVYDDRIPVYGEKSAYKRYQLCNKQVFSGLYKTKNEDFWYNVASYIDNTYDVDYLENVFLLSDGGNWIKKGASILPKCTQVLDDFHLNKYINGAAIQLELSVDDAKRELYQAIENKDRKEFNSVIRKILNCCDEHKHGPVLLCQKYVTGNWKAITNRIEYRSLLHGCSAEGQVSHILSARLSSRPMGWSEHGCDVMAKLRAYEASGGEVIDFMRANRKKKQRELTVSEQNALVKRMRNDNAKYSEAITHSIPGIERIKYKVLRDIAFGEKYA